MSGHIVVDDLSFSYGKTVVLENIGLTIEKHQIITLIGPNGGGKTTLLRLIAGLLMPDKGTISINGKPPKCNHGHIGYVPQYVHFDNKYPITVFEVVLSGLIKPMGFYSREDKLKTQRMIDDAGLLSVRDKPFMRLSGGQTQRMLIARALVSDADILLLDEPTSNVDANNEKNLAHFLKTMGRRMTILIVTHDTGFVAGITDRVFCINKKLVEHPIDADFSDIISSSYGMPTKIVRHNTIVSPSTENGCGTCHD